jgi:hypothetical protein
LRDRLRYETPVFTPERERDGSVQASRIYRTTTTPSASSPKNSGVVYCARRPLDTRRLLRWCYGLPIDTGIPDVGGGDGFHLRLLNVYGW